MGLLVRFKSPSCGPV